MLPEPNNNPAGRGLAELIDRSATVTQRRNAVIHGLYAQELDGPRMLFANDAWQPVPTPDDLNALATQIATITQDIHEARLHGFLAQALGAVPKCPRK